MKILISACLLGVKCRYDGEQKPNAELFDLIKNHELAPFCPEIYGGLPTPREPAEQRGDKVFTISGKDVTAEYESGAREAARLAQLLGCELAILQDRSPSCGCGTIHDGSFTGALIPGDGVTAAYLKAAGIKTLAASEAIRLFSN